MIVIPHMIKFIGEKNLEKGEIEYKNRRTGEKQIIAKERIIKFLAQRVNA